MLPLGLSGSGVTATFVIYVTFRGPSERGGEPLFCWHPACNFLFVVNHRGQKGVRADRGFTLVELLIAVVIIGLLSSMAITQSSNFKDRSFATTMRSDLRNFATYEESYFYDNAVYSSDLGLVEAQGYQPSPSVTITIAEATATGWAATAIHGQSTVECALFVGDAASVGAATDEGVAECQ